MIPGGPSEAAIDAALTQLERPRCRTTIVDRRNLVQAMDCAHDRALGTDRSVNLGAVSAWLRTSAPGMAAWQREQIADAVAREFGR